MTLRDQGKTDDVAGWMRLSQSQAARIAQLEAENGRLLSLVCQWSENCTGRHGSQMQCVTAETNVDQSTKGE